MFKQLKFCHYRLQSALDSLLRFSRHQTNMILITIGGKHRLALLQVPDYVKIYRDRC